LTEQHRLIAGRYRLLEHVGRGAMGIVWRAHDESLDRPVAVKEFVHYTDATDTGSTSAVADRRRVMREGRIAARLQHPNAVNVYNVVEDDGRPWLIMEYQSSRSLADVIAERGRLPPAEVRSIGQQLAAALAAAHAAGIVHRDVKPGNVLIAEDGTAKLTDFGISHTVGDGTITATGDIAGTPAFFAPEVARGEQATFASDVFSLGSTLYNAVEGKPPFDDNDNQIALLYRVATGEIDPPGAAGVLAPVLGQLLQSDPAFRPDMKAARAALAAAAREQVTPSEATVATTPVSRPTSTRRARVGSVVTGVVVLAAAATLFVVLRVVPGSNDSPAASGSAATGRGEHVAATATSAPATSTATAGSETSAGSASATATASGSSTRSSDTKSSSPVRAVRSYYSTIPDDLRAGYAQLSDSFKNTRTSSFASYRTFWEQFADVELSDVEKAGDNRVRATITYVSENGNEQVEHHLYTLEHSSDGWVIDSQQAY